MCCVANGSCDPQLFLISYQDIVGRLEKSIWQNLWQSGMSFKKKKLTCSHTNLQTYLIIMYIIWFFQTELIFRRTVWEKNLLMLLRHNQEASAGKQSFVLGLNHLADMVGWWDLVVVLGWNALGASSSFCYHYNQLLL